MIYDCFSFFNELDILEIRLNVLKDVVDKFVIVEAGETHTGKPKPFYFEENRDRFAAFADKIIHYKIERFPEGHEAWWNENYQRNEIQKCLVGCNDDDDIIISDLDEIPNPDAVREYRSTPGIKDFRHRYYSYYLNYHDVRTPVMYISKMMPYHMLCHAYDDVEVEYDEFLPPDINVGTTVTKVRRRTLPRSHGGEVKTKQYGWHFTCIGGAKAMLTKMRAVAPHHGFNPDDKGLTEDKLVALIAKGQGPALKMNCFAVELDSSFPKYILDNQSKYSQLIFPVTPEYCRRVRFARLFRTFQGSLKQMCERMMPAGLHLFLHRIRVAVS